MTDNDSHKLSGELAQAMTRLRARLRRESSPESASWTWSQITTLARIGREGPCTVADLAHAEHVRPQSMAGTIATLRGQGLVEARPDENDRRKMLLEATEQGKQLIVTIPAVREAWLHAALSSALTEDERETIRQAIPLMERLADWVDVSSDRATSKRTTASRRP